MCGSVRTVAPHFLQDGIQVKVVLEQLYLFLFVRTKQLGAWETRDFGLASWRGLGPLPLAPADRLARQILFPASDFIRVPRQLLRAGREVDLDFVDRPFPTHLSALGA